MRTRESVDLFGVLLVATALVLVIFVAPAASWLRVALGLPFVLFLPGYALVAALFPGASPAGPGPGPGAGPGASRGLGALERVALSVGLSIAAVPLLGLALNYTPWGIRLAPVVLTLYTFTILLATVALARRARLPPIARPEFALSLPRVGWRAMAPVDKALVAAALVAVLLAAGATAYVVVAPRPGEAFTEFYVLGPDGKAEGYPTTLAANQTGRVLVGVVNHERDAAFYVVRASLVPVTFAPNATGVLVPQEGAPSQPLASWRLTLRDGETNETALDVRAPTAAAWKLQIDLEKEGVEGSYRTLHLWINAPAGAGT